MFILQELEYRRLDNFQSQIYRTKVTLIFLSNVIKLTIRIRKMFFSSAKQ